MPTTTATALFTSSGLSSGLDTNAIVDALARVEALPIDGIKATETAMKSQISTLGTLASKLAALQTAAKNLGTSGPVAITVQSSNTSFSAVAATGALAGAYDVQVQSLAAAAKGRSQAYGAVDAPVIGGAFHFSINGKSTDLTIPDGAKLNDVAALINGSGAGVNAGVIFDGTSAYLTLTNAATGYVGSSPSAALGVTYTATGTTGTAPAVTTTQAATNAAFTIDGLSITRQSNTINDALKGVTFTLGKSGGASESLAIGNDLANAQGRLEGFLGAYNDIASMVNAQLTPSSVGSRSGTLASDESLREVQQRLQDIVASSVSGSGGVRSLADLGLHTQKDGTLTVDAATFNAAVARDPTAVNALFSAPTTGISALVAATVKDETDPVSGLLTVESTGLTDRLKTLGDEATRLQEHVDSYRQTLLDQFTAMETLLSSLKNTSNYLTQLSNQATSNK